MGTLKIGTAPEAQIMNSAEIQECYVECKDSGVTLWIEISPEGLIVDIPPRFLIKDKERGLDTLQKFLEAERTLSEFCQLHPELLCRKNVEWREEREKLVTVSRNLFYELRELTGRTFTALKA